MCDTTLNDDIAVDIIDTSLLRRSERRERNEICNINISFF